GGRTYGPMAGGNGHKRRPSLRILEIPRLCSCHPRRRQVRRRDKQAGGGPRHKGSVAAVRRCPAMGHRAIRPPYPTNLLATASLVFFSFCLLSLGSAHRPSCLALAAPAFVWHGWRD